MKPYRLNNKERKVFIHYMVREVQNFQSAGASAQNRSFKKIHQLRVSCRRLRVALRLLEGQSTFATKSLRSALQKIGRASSAAREIEVAQKDASRYGLDAKILRLEQRSARKRIVNILHTKSYQKLVNNLKNIVQVLIKNDQAIQVISMDEFNTLRRWEKQYPMNIKQFHKLRIYVKKARYALEALGKATGPLAKLQNILGRVHDLEVLESFFGRKKRIDREIYTLQKKAEKNLEPAIKFAMEKIHYSK